MIKTHLRTLLAVLLLTTCAGALSIAAAEVVRFYGTALRGVSFVAAPGDAAPAGSLYGVNVRLHQEAPADTAALLGAAAGGGYGWVRQEFPWADIEPRRGEYRWDAWDRVVDLAGREGLRLIAVVDTSPGWARGNSQRTSPPDDAADLARFVGELAGRYRGRVAAYQIWDEPNIAPNWGPRYASAAEYTRLLQAAYRAGKAADPSATFLSAALAPTTERSERNISDIVFLESMYKAGARGSFDALAAKPYGFWTGPDDRRVDAGVLNFSRLILLREAMERAGDSGLGVWAVEMGWNALPADWQGRASPWGSDSPDRQARRTVAALARARSEWPWLSVMVMPALRYPAAAADDPIRGFALLDDAMSPRPAFSAIRDSGLKEQMRGLPELRADLGQYVGTMAALLAVLAVAAWLLAGRLRLLPWADWIAAYRGLPEAAQVGAMVTALLAYQASPWPAGSLAAAAILAALSLMRPDLGLVAAAAAIPFAQLPRRLVGGWEFTALEVLTVACAMAAAWRWWLRRRPDAAPRASSDAPAEQAGSLWRRVAAVPAGADWPVLLIVALSLASMFAAADPKAAARELRLVILEPALLYLLLTRAAAGWPVGGRRLAERLAAALVAGGAAAGLMGLYQYAITSRVITAEGGLRRMLGPYPSPNALGLFLERVLPLALSLGLAAWLARSGRRMLEGRGVPFRGLLAPAKWLAAAAVLGAAVLLTFSVGAWAAAALGCAIVAVSQPRRVALALAGLGLLGAVLALPLARTERVASHFDLQNLTTSAVRVSVWQSAVDLIRDHPVTGVGLDGFLELYRTRYIRPEAWREPDLSHPHNLLLEAWTSLGILGPPAYAWLILWVFRLAWRLRRPGPARALALGLAAGAAAGAAHGLVDRYLAGAPDIGALFFITLGILVVLDRVVAEPAGPAGRSMPSGQSRIAG